VCKIDYRLIGAEALSELDEVQGNWIALDVEPPLDLDQA
jgi:hypothetical protein